MKLGETVACHSLEGMYLCGSIPIQSMWWCGRRAGSKVSKGHIFHWGNAGSHGLGIRG